MPENPIRYSDLISPDDSIEKLIGQLEQLNEAYTGMAESVKAQASSVASSLRNVSGATEAGRKATKDASDEALRLERAYKQLDVALGQNAKEIARLNEIKREANNYNKNMVKLGGEEIKTREQISQATYNQLSAQYSLNKAYLNSLNAEEREIKANKELIKTTNDIYEQMKRLQEATGKYSLNVGNYTNSISQAIGMNSKWYQGMQQIAALTEDGLANGLKTAGAAVGTLGKQLLALLANPIVAVIAGITAAFMALAKGISSSEENTNTLMRVLAPFERILTAIVSVLQDVAGWLLKGVEGMEKLAMGASRLIERLPLVGNAMKKVNDALAENIELTRQKQMLEKAERSKNEAQAKLARDVAMYKNLAAGTNDLAMKTHYLNMAKKGEQMILTNELKLARKDYEIKKKLADQSQNDKKTNDELSQARVRLYKAEQDYYNGTMRLEKQLNTLRTKQNKPTGGGGGGNAGNTAAIDAAKTALEEQRKIEDEKIKLIEDSYEREWKQTVIHYERMIEDAKEKYGEATELAVLYEQEKQQKLADLFDKEIEKNNAAEKKKADEQKKAVEDGKRQRELAIREAEEEIARQYDLDISVSELERNENKKTEMRLQAEKKRLQALLDLYEKDGQTLTEAEVQTIKNSIAAVDQELAKNKKHKDIWDTLGFKLDEEQKDAINESVSYAVDSLNQFMSAYVAAAEAKKQMADEAVASAQKTLEAEIEARNAGYANEVDTARKELDEARKNQQKAIREQQKAQQAQELIDAATQTSSLITATANIWKSMTGTGPWGTALAIAATALMWGSFAAAKIKAHEVAGSGTEQYGEGTVEMLQGGSHQSGNDIDLGRKRDGTRRRAEGGEFFAVINKRNSRRYRREIPDVIHSLNDGTFADKYMNAYDGGGVAVNVQPERTDLRELTDSVNDIRDQGKQRTFSDGKGNVVVIYKNLKRTITHGGN